MPPQVEKVTLSGTLRSVDGTLKRKCKVAAERLDHGGVFTYEKLHIIDKDNWPVGNYVLEDYGGEPARLHKKEIGGTYYGGHLTPASLEALSASA